MRWLVAAAVLTAFAVGCGGDEADEPSPGRTERLTVTTGGRGGIYYLYGRAYASAISRGLPGYRATAEESTGAVQNLLRLRDGKADIALTLGDTALDAVEGREAFRTPVPLRALAQIYRSYVQVVVPRGSGIRTLRDLRGRRVSVGSPDSGTEVVAERLLELARVDSGKDFRRRRLGVAESAAALRDGSLDAFFWSGGLPTDAIEALARARPVTLLDVGRFARPLRSRYGGVYEDASIPSGTYEGVAAPIPTVSIPNYVVVRENMNGGLAFDLTELIFKRAGDLARAQPESRDLTPESARRVIAPIALHEGALQYYDRTGG